MANPRIKLYLFLDNNVPDSIGRWLQRRGHSVFRQRHHIPANSPDPAVATTAMQAGRILLTQDKDFNQQRFDQPRYATLSRISLTGVSHTLMPALKEHIHLVEAQWAHVKASGQPRMLAYIKKGCIRFRT